MLKEFKEFAMKGSVMDLAIGVIVGAAFGKVVESVVNDVIMPPIGLLLGKVDFSNLFIVLAEGSPPGPYSTPDVAATAGAVTLNYGLFVNTIINFLIVAFAVFFMVKAINRMRAAPPPPPATPPEPSAEEKLLGEIRDLLKARS